MLFFKSDLCLLQPKVCSSNNFLVQLGQGHNFSSSRGDMAILKMSNLNRCPRAQKEPGDRLCKELQQPKEATQTGEEAVLQVSVRGLGLVKEDVTMKSLQLGIYLKVCEFRYLRRALKKQIIPLSQAGKLTPHIRQHIKYKSHTSIHKGSGQEWGELK